MLATKSHRVIYTTYVIFSWIGKIDNCNLRRGAFPCDYLIQCILSYNWLSTDQIIFLNNLKSAG